MKFLSGTYTKNQNPMFLIVTVILTSCAPKPSILEITHKDLQHFNEILTRQGENVRFFPSYDKTFLAVTVKEQEGSLRGTVLFIHGIAARSQLYLPLADELNNAGFAVYLLDLRGHGFSRGEPGTVPDRNAISRDVEYFTEFVKTQIEEDVPLYGMGHSLGTFIWINTFAQSSEINLDGLVLISGGIYPDQADDLPKENKNRDFVYLHPLSLVGSVFCNNLKPIEVVLPDIPQKQDAKFVLHYHPGFFTMFLGAEERFDNFYENTDIPIYFITGEKDEIMKIEYIQSMFDKTNSPEKTMTVLPNSTHTSII